MRIHVILLLLCLLMASKFEPAFACPPLRAEELAKARPWSEIVADIYADAKTVALVEVTKVVSQSAPAKYLSNARIERVYFRTLMAYKGNAKDIPTFSELHRDGTDCDMSGFRKETKIVVFFSDSGKLLLSGYQNELQETETKKQIEKLSSKSNL